MTFEDDEDEMRQTEEDEDDDGALGLLDGLAQFHLRAEARARDLLQATDRRVRIALLSVCYSGSCMAQRTLARQLFRHEDVPDEDEASGQHFRPMTDHMRLTRPPAFHRWQQTFSYLQVTGSALFANACDEHVQILPAISPTAAVQAETPAPLAIYGRACSTTADPSLPPQEETIMSDGLMEEIVLQDTRSDTDEWDEQGLSSSHCLSPRASRLAERQDELTIQSYESAVVPLIAAFVRRLLERHQHQLHTERLAQEAEAQRAVNELRKYEEACRVEQERRVIQEAAERADHERAWQIEAEREAERKALLAKQQLEENDEEEIKIKTLAYSHTREWFQPNKKCFSHRGRQLTYLKPVLKLKNEGSTNQNPTPKTPERRRRLAKKIPQRSTIYKEESASSRCSTQAVSLNASMLPSRPAMPRESQLKETIEGRATSAGSVNNSDQLQRRLTRLPRINSSAANEIKPAAEERKSPYRIPPSLLLVARKTKRSTSKHKHQLKAT